MSGYFTPKCILARRDTTILSNNKKLKCKLILFYFWTIRKKTASFSILYTGKSIKTKLYEKSCLEIECTTKEHWMTQRERPSSMEFCEPICGCSMCAGVTIVIALNSLFKMLTRTCCGIISIYQTFQETPKPKKDIYKCKLAKLWSQREGVRERGSEASESAGKLTHRALDFVPIA